MDVKTMRLTRSSSVGGEGKANFPIAYFPSASRWLEANGIGSNMLGPSVEWLDLRPLGDWYPSARWTDGVAGAECDESVFDGDGGSNSGGAILSGMPRTAANGSPRWEFHGEE